jgi:hypothetical protein
MGLDECVMVALREGKLVHWKNLALYVSRENIIMPGTTLNILLGGGGQFFADFSLFAQVLEPEPPPVPRI